MESLEQIRARAEAAVPGAEIDIVPTEIRDSRRETDSGLDIDAPKTVAHGVNSLRSPDLGVLSIIPDYVHVMVAGRIVRSGRKELALELEERGYDWAREEAAEPVLR